MAGYEEYAAPPALRALVACTWQDSAALDRPRLVIPDGCVDLLWQRGLGLSVVGADTGPVLHEPFGTVTYGIRLRASAAGAVLGMPASQVLDQQVALAEIWPSATAAARQLEGGVRDPFEALTRLVAEHASEPDPLVAAAARLLCAHGIPVAQAAEHLGVSERTLHRRMTASVGYGPKMLARVTRLRRLIAAPAGPLAERAITAGYASQSHMSDEVHRLTGLTPVRFLEDARLTAA
ncbi:MAG: helix-turn-helix transcriptional regulator [Nocardioides sp.]|nr:helix-turn-helix transcriptional regulator [Nocardioides sp.]